MAVGSSSLSWQWGTHRCHSSVVLPGGQNLEAPQTVEAHHGGHQQVADQPIKERQHIRSLIQIQCTRCIRLSGSDYPSLSLSLSVPPFLNLTLLSHHIYFSLSLSSLHFSLFIYPSLQPSPFFPLSLSPSLTPLLLFSSECA